jgi:transcriptional regulator with XRE-family HTH domain
MIRYREILGKKLRLLREINGSVTQEQLGMLLGYSSNSAISLIESGKRGMGQDKIVHAAKALGVNPAVLLSDRDMSQEELEFYVLFETAFKCESTLLPAVKTLLREAARCGP